jgi:hypothetical protein
MSTGAWVPVGDQLIGDSEGGGRGVGPVDWSDGVSGECGERSFLFASQAVIIPFSLLGLLGDEDLPTEATGGGDDESSCDGKKASAVETEAGGEVKETTKEEGDDRLTLRVSAVTPVEIFFTKRQYDLMLSSIIWSTLQSYPPEATSDNSGTTGAATTSPSSSPSSSSPSSSSSSSSSSFERIKKKDKKGKKMGHVKSKELHGERGGSVGNVGSSGSCGRGWGGGGIGPMLRITLDLPLLRGFVISPDLPPSVASTYARRGVPHGSGALIDLQLCGCRLTYLDNDHRPGAAVKSTSSCVLVHRLYTCKYVFVYRL